MTSDLLVGAEIVLADGRILECDEHHEKDLFWALRGAGAGSFGVVTSLVFRTVPAPDATNVHLTWPFPPGEELGHVSPVGSHGMYRQPPLVA